MYFDISVDNIKCGGCANTIRTRLLEMERIQDIEVDIENGVVRVYGDTPDRGTVSARLESLGYPESGTARGFQSVKAKAKSFVSCAVGRIESRD